MFDYEDQSELSRTKYFTNHIQQLLPEYCIEKPEGLYCEYSDMSTIAISKMRSKKADVVGFFYEKTDNEGTLSEESEEDDLNIPQCLAGMLSVAANNAVKYLRRRVPPPLPLTYLISHGVCATPSKAVYLK